VRRLEVPLAGATELAVGAEGSYTAAVNVSATEAERVEAVVRCTNCGEAHALTNE
jgi:formylmethanofuran dehydrogenase subunit E